MRKSFWILRELLRLVGRHKAWFLLPILVGLVAVGFMVVSLGPAAVVAFLYAGI